jgi:hypothetical protein
MSFPASAGAKEISVTYADQRKRTAESWALLGLWVVALWITRKPARR